MKTAYVGIISCTEDVHADEVEKYASKKVNVYRLDSDGFPSSLNQVEIRSQSADFVLSKGVNKIHLDKLTSLWYRKPAYPLDSFSSDNIGAVLAHKYKIQETKAVFDSLMYTAEKRGVFLVSPLASITRARHKLYQLMLAEETGLKTPKTLVASDVKLAEEFITIHGGEVITKVLDAGNINYGDKWLSFFTYPLTLNKFKQKFKKMKTIDYPLFLQEKIEKKLELRITVIGNKIFACSIDSQANKQSQIDFRMVDPYKLKHEPFSLDTQIKKMCFELCSRLNLQFGAIDMALTKEGEYVFFEINPNGQYLWIEDLTGMPLSKAMADLLTNPADNMLRA